MFSRIGAFHFGKNHENPIGSLTTAIKEQSQERANSLIVLPEAMNISKKYDDTTKQPNYDPKIIKALSEISTSHKIAFVTGLIVKSQDGPNPPYSSAYFIKGEERKLMCYKRFCDGIGDYTQYPISDYDNIKNPLYLDNNSLIASLICGDIGKPYGNCILKRVNDQPCSNKIICIPAHMRNPHWVMFQEKLPTEWEGKIVILANSSSFCPSFISNIRCEKIRTNQNMADNET